VTPDSAEHYDLALGYLNSAVLPMRARVNKSVPSGGHIAKCRKAIVDIQNDNTIK